MAGLITNVNGARLPAKPNPNKKLTPLRTKAKNTLGTIKKKPAKPLHSGVKTPGQQLGKVFTGIN